MDGRGLDASDRRLLHLLQHGYGGGPVGLDTLAAGLGEDPATLAQTVMAANAPMLLQRSMVDGYPAQGVMSAGQVAALIGSLASCEEVIHGIVTQACERRASLNALI